MSGSSALSAHAPSTPFPAVYVSLLTGEVVEVSPATDVALEAEVVVVYNGTQRVATYRRDVVFSCSKTPTPPSFT